MPTDRTNILIIMTDQQRYDIFSHRGNTHIETPHLDRLAEEGVLFTDATCTDPLCGPSRAAMLSGCYRFDGKYKRANREPDGPSLFTEKITTADEALAQAGYHVEYHGKWHTGNEHLGCYRGDNRVWGHRLPEWHDHIASKYDRPEGHEYAVDPYSGWPYRKVPLDDIASREASGKYTVYKNNCYGIFEIENEDTMTAFTVDKTVRFLESGPEKPFSVTCSILHPHLPFTPNQYYADMFAPDDMPIPDNIESFYHPDFNMFHGDRDRKKAIPELISPDGKGLGQFLALYYALIKEVDDQVGRLLDTLEKAGYKDNTLVIFTSDHGDMGGSHNCFAKGNFFEESLRVPLIMRYPDGIPAGTVLNSPAAGADLAPTILDYSRIPLLPQFHGRSLKTDIETGRSEQTWAYAEMQSQGRDYYCMRSHEWKVIFDREYKPAVLFDLKNDIGEFRNLLDEDSGNSNAVIQEARELLTAEYTT